MSLPYDAKDSSLGTSSLGTSFGASLTAPTAAPAAARVTTSKLAHIQYLRAAAALAVVLFHAAVYIEHNRDDASFNAVLAPFGAYGVAIFFAISGYLMARVVETAEASRFLLHRVARIYPAFLLVVVVHQLLVPSVLRPPIDWVALTLVPAGHRGYPIGVEWTLLFEMTFYVALFTFMATGLARHLERIAIAWLGLILLATLTLPDNLTTLGTPDLWQLPMQPPNVAFAGGLLIPALLRKRLLPPAAVCLVALVAGMAVFEALPLPIGRWVAGIAATLVVAAAVRRDKAGTEAPIAPLLTLGDWSYALYLVHAPILLGFVKLLPESVPNAVVFASGTAASLIAAAAIGRFDVSFYRRVKRIIDSLSPTRCRWLAAAFVAFFVAVAVYFPSVRMWKEWQDATAQKILASLPPEAFRSEAAALAATAAAGTAPANFSGALERVETTENGHLFLSGWAFDRDRPGGTVFMAAYCQGRQILLAKRIRLRPDVAAELGRRDLRRQRIGFAVATEKPQSCAAADLTLFAVDLKGWAAAVPAAAPGDAPSLPAPPTSPPVSGGR